MVTMGICLRAQRKVPSVAPGTPAYSGSRPLTRRVAQTFGLDEITVRPDLVARETDPSARFTFGKRVGQFLALVYSAGLGGPETRRGAGRG